MTKKPVGGVDEVAKMLQHMDDAEREKLLASLAARDPDLTRKIQDKLFTFEDLVNEEPKKVQTLLREVPAAQLALAMRGASADLMEFALKNMSAAAGKRLIDDIAATPPQKVTDVQLARQKILEKLKSLG